MRDGVPNGPTGIVRVNDPDDPRVSDFRSLTDASHRRAVEAPGPFHRGFFIAEGWIVAERLLQSRFGVRSFLVAEHRLDRLKSLLGRRSALVYAAPQDVVNRIVGFPLHRGVLASANRELPLLVSTVVGRSQTLLFAENMTNAENLGSLIRNAAALGADGLIVDDTSADPWSRRSIRVSMGHALTVPIARGSADVFFDQCLRFAVDTIALTPNAATPLTSYDCTGRIALLVGAEGPGLTNAVLDRANRTIRIEMVPQVDSLNVATAAAIAMHHCFSTNRAQHQVPP